MKNRRIVIAGLGLCVCLSWMLTSTLAGDREAARFETVDQVNRPAPSGADAGVQVESPGSSNLADDLSDSSDRFIILNRLSEEELSHLISPMVLPPEGSPAAALARGVGDPFCNFGSSTACGNQAYCSDTPASTSVIRPGNGMVLDNVELDLPDAMAADPTAEICEVTLLVNAAAAAVPYTVTLSIWDDCPPSQFGGPGTLRGTASVVINTPFTTPAVFTFNPPVIVPNNDTTDPPVGAAIDCWLGMEVSGTADPSPAWAIRTCPAEVELGFSEVNFGLFLGVNMGCNFVFDLQGCPNNPPPGTMQAEVRVGTLEPGACCDDLTGLCTDPVDAASCIAATQRFVPGKTCVQAVNDGDFDPACGQGACCLAGNMCVDTTDADCTNMGGFVFKTGVTCAEADCSPIPDNDNCLNKEALTAQSVCVTFNNVNATDSPAPDSNCGAIGKDVWYSYVVPQTTPASVAGDLIVSTVGSSFDTIVAIYGPLTGAQAADCNTVETGAVGSEAECNDDLLEGANVSCTSYALLASVMPGQVYKIRVGSATGSIGGAGQVNIDYVPRGNPPDWFGADVGRCCFPNGTCQIVNATSGAQNCLALGGFAATLTNFTNGNNPGSEEGLGCKSAPCPGPGEECWNAIDLKSASELNGSFGTITRLIRGKLYYKYRLVAGENFTIDTCGSDFDTLIEVYGSNCLPGPGQNASGRPENLIFLNDNCTLDDPDGTAGPARDGANCFAPTGESDSCLCINVNDPQQPGLASGLDIIICIGAANPNRGDPMFPNAENSVDPRPNACDEPALASITITSVPQCFVCDVDCDNDLTIQQQARRLNESEDLCDDLNWLTTNNGGCSVFPEPLGGVAPPVESINAFLTANMLNLDDGPIYICGTSGTIGIDQNDTNPNVPMIGQQRDNDYYELVLTGRKRVTWQVFKADFLVNAVIFRQDGDDPCNLTDLVALDTLVDCVDTGDTLTADLCPGRYYLVVRPTIDDDNKPPCGSEYIMCLTCTSIPGQNCCEGDVNNDGLINGLDIAPWIQGYLFPDPTSDGTGTTGDDLGSCGSLEFCRVDVDGDGTLTLNDLDAFVDLLIAFPKSECEDKGCNDPSRCQLADPNPPTTIAVTSDLDPTFNFRVADNFCTTETGVITEVCWVGEYIDTSGPTTVDCGPTTADGFVLPLDDFTITYYVDNDGCPGSVKFSMTSPAIFSQSGGTLMNVTRQDTGISVGSGRDILFTATHAPVPVTAGECCWIEIVNNTAEDNCRWLWRVSTTADNRSVQTGGDAAEYVCEDDVNAFDLAFCFNLHISDRGCDKTPTVVGRCCYGVGECVETTEEICSSIFDGNFDTWDCTECCPAPDCELDFSNCTHREIEQCGFSKNDGCNDPDNVMGSVQPAESLGQLTCGTPIVVCGTLFATGGTFDTDFYQFTLPALGNSQWKVTIEAEMLTNVFNLVPADTQDPCGDLGNDALNIAQADEDCDAVMSTPICQAAGGPSNPVTLLVQIGGAGTAELPCGTRNNYKLTIECEPCLVCDISPDCPPGGTNESDLNCSLPGPDSNGGCANDPGMEMFDVIQCDDVICGTTSLTPDLIGGVTTRDVDWYLLELTQTTLVTYTITAEFDVTAFIGTNPFVDCDNTGLTITSTNANIDDCDPLTFSACLEPGTYSLLVLATFPDEFGSVTIVCGQQPSVGQPGSHYTLEVTCSTPCDPAPPPTCNNNADSCQDPDIVTVAGTDDILVAGFLSDEDQKNTIFDDFLPTASGNVQNICWFGFEDDLLIPGLQDCLMSAGDDFTVTYYADAGNNEPDLNTVLGSFSQSGGSLTVTRTAIGTFDGSTSYRYEASHAAVGVTAGTCVWIAVKQDNGECFCNWFWAQSDGVGGNGRIAAEVEDNTGTVTLDPASDVDMAFCVDIATDPAGCPIIGACCDGTNCTGDTTAAGCAFNFFPFDSCSDPDFSCPEGICGVPAFCQLPNENDAGTSDADAGAESRDDFQPTANGNVTSICWWGPYLPNAAGAGFADDFRITYFADAGGAPDFGTVIGGPFLQSGGGLTGFTKVDSGLDVAGVADVFQFEANHAPVAVTAGTCFWVEIVQVQDNGGVTWFWEESSDGNGSFSQGAAGVSTIFADDRAFCVNIAVEAASCP